MKKLVFTDHASERMYLRGISKSMVQSALQHHDEMKKEDDGDIKFIKAVNRKGSRKNLHVVAKPIPEQGKDAWLIKTLWIRGEDDPIFILKAIRMFFIRAFRRKHR